MDKTSNACQSESRLPPDKTPIAPDLPVVQEKKKRKYNPKSLLNLTASQYKPGQSGNPEGAGLVRPMVDPLEIKNALYRVFQQVYGDGNINSSRLVKFAKTKPVQFMRLVAQVMPKDVEINGKIEGQETRILIIQQSNNGEQVGKTITINGTQEVPKKLVGDSVKVPFIDASECSKEVKDGNPLLQNEAGDLDEVGERGGEVSEGGIPPDAPG